jgi:hypothetical protein
MMSREDIRAALLRLSVDDWTGLWEILWFIQTMYPDLESDRKREVALDALRSLLGMGLVRLVYFEEVGNKEEMISQDDYDDVLALERSWAPPEIAFGRHVRFVATDAGRKLWRRMMGLEPRLPHDPF